jgi:hypothetical protein
MPSPTRFKYPSGNSPAFFEILGRCIVAWAHVDDELFRVFRDCVGPTEQCAIIYYRLGHARVRHRDGERPLRHCICHRAQPEKQHGEHISGPPRAASETTIRRRPHWETRQDNDLVALRGANICAGFDAKFDRAWSKS